MPTNKSIVDKKLKGVLAKERIEWRIHVLQRLAERGIEQAAVLEVLRPGERIEDYPDYFPYPGALFLGVVDDRPLHVVVALDEENEWAYIITAYEPDSEHFETDYRKRKMP